MKASRCDLSVHFQVFQISSLWHDANSSCFMQIICHFQGLVWPVPSLVDKDMNK